MDRHGRLFNRIAPIYNWFFNIQVREYRCILERNIHLLSLKKEAKILDLGCGTGAFSLSFAEHGFSVTGVDIAPTMLKYAEKSSFNRKINYTLGDITGKLPFRNNSFDLVVSSYVCHGLDFDNRNSYYIEALRVSKGKLLIQDFNFKRSLPVSIIEWFEGGGYFSFIDTGLDKMKEHFENVKVVPVTKKLNWYLCE